MMSKKIVLVCAGGFSTSMLVTRMKESMDKKEMDYEILATGEDDVDNHPDSDLFLLGPQIGHQLEFFQKKFSVPVHIIDSMDYGTMDGTSVLKKAMKWMGEY